MSNTSQPQGEQGGKHPAREAPAEHGEVPRKRDDSKDDKNTFCSTSSQEESHGDS